MRNRIRLFSPATAHVFMVSFLLGGVGALMIGLQGSLQKAEDSIQERLKVVIFFQPSVTDEAAKAWTAGLPARDPAIASSIFISRQEALEKAQGNPSLVKSLLIMRENPLPPTALLRYTESAWLERSEPALSLRTAPEVQEIRWDPEARSLFRSIRQWRMWLLRISSFAIVLMAIWCSFGIYRFWLLRASWAELLVQLGNGLVGGGLALVTFDLALKGVGLDAAMYKAPILSVWPLVASLMAALATFGWKVSNES